VNAPLRRVAIACLVLFGLLLVNINYRQVVKASDYRDNQRNARVIVRNYEKERGSIALAGANRPLIARSVETPGRLKYLRTYPDKDLYAHVTGFYSLVYGQDGLEDTEDRVLSGDDPRLFVKRLSDTLTGRVPRGGDVVVTLQQAAQQAAYDGLKGKRGAVVALDPRTGAILALASAPTYDPGLLSSFDPAAIRAYRTALLAPAAGDPLLDRALSQTYPPGSIFKVVTAAAALQDGVTPDTQIPSPTVLTLPQTSATLSNFGGESCGSGPTTSLADALRISCNTAFAQLGLTIGEGRLRAQAEAFGFGDGSLTVPDPVAASTFPGALDPPSLAQSAIGQRDVRVTPLQMAMVAAGVADGGTVMAPYLVREVQAPDLTRLSLAQPKAYRQAVPRLVADQLRTMMEAVVANGTGTAAQIPGVRVAGKTGTAQNAPGAAPHAWFIGFAPADDPQVAVAVIVENGGDAGSEATGGKVAAPIARAVMRAVLGR